MHVRPSVFRGVVGAFAARALMVGLAGGTVACTEAGDDGDGVDPPAACSATSYRVAAVELAETWGDATRLGLDLDGDGDVDNKLGSLNATLTQVYGDWRPEAAMTELLARAPAAWIARVDRCEGSNGLAVRLATGVDRNGDGAFEVADWGEPATGDGLVARGGVGFLPVGRLGAGSGEAAGDGWSAELGLMVALHPGGRDLTATIGFGVAVTDELLAPVAGFLSEALERGDSRFADGLDLDRDGAVSVGELRQASAVRTLLANDLDLTVPCGGGDCYQPGGDGLVDRISLGFGVTLRAVELE
jgi:hypothetical protein